MKILIVLLISLLFISGCATGGPTNSTYENFSLYHDDLRGIRLKYPSDWIIKNASSYIGLTYSNNFSRGDFDTLIIETTKLSIIDTWTLEEQLNTTLRFIGNDQILSLNKTSFKGKPVYKMVSRNDDVFTMWLFTIRDYKLYDMKFLAEEKDYTKHIKTMELILDSIEFI